MIEPRRSDPSGHAACEEVEPEFDPLSDPARRLLAAADELFYRRGVKGTTVRDITGACGLSPGALYNHFSSKDELLFHLVLTRHLRIEEQVAAAQLAVAGDPRAELLAIVAVYVRAHVGGRRGAAVANRQYPDLPGPEREQVIAIRRRLRDRVVEVLRRGSVAGIFDICGGTDRPSLVVAGSTVLEMCINASQWLRPGGAITVDDLVARFGEMSLRLVGAARAGTPPVTQPLAGARAARDARDVD